MAETDDLIAGSGIALNILKQAIEEEKEILTLKKEDGLKILDYVEKSRIKFEEGKPSKGKKGKSSSHEKKKTVYVYMYKDTEDNPHQTIENAFIEFLSKMSITCVSFTEERKLTGDFPLIVLCPISSRLQSDINFVLEKLNKFPLPGRFALVVINMTREDQLPRLPIKKRIEEPSSDYINIHFIDMAFTKENLLYDCDMNKKAGNEIKSFVKDMNKK